MKTYVSLWSADLLDIGRAIEAVDELAEGFHIDVFDGHNVRELLFGPDHVAAMRRRTTSLIDVHLNVMDPDYWAVRFIDAGADVVTVQMRASQDFNGTIDLIRRAGVHAGVGVEVDQEIDEVLPYLDDVDRVLLMGTAIGIKGVDLDPEAPARVKSLVEMRRNQPQTRQPEIVVDGGIRSHTVEPLALAGADGVVPGSLVFGAEDPLQEVRRIQSL